MPTTYIYSSTWQGITILTISHLFIGMKILFIEYQIWLLTFLIMTSKCYRITWSLLLLPHSLPIVLGLSYFTIITVWPLHISTGRILVTKIFKHSELCRVMSYESKICKSKGLDYCSMFYAWYNQYQHKKIIITRPYSIKELACLEFNTSLCPTRCLVCNG